MRGQRKAASDSLAQLQADATAEDISATDPPAIDGDFALDEIGKKFLGDLWRSDHERWSPADLAMMLESAFVHQQMFANRVVCTTTPHFVTLSNGVVAIAPCHRMQADLDKRLRDLFCALGVRGRDGAKPAIRKPQAIPKAKSGNVSKFDDFL